VTKSNSIRGEGIAPPSMKKHPAVSHAAPVHPVEVAPRHPTEEEIREKALELYVRSGWLPGRDLENWLEAEAFLIAHPEALRMAHEEHHESAHAQIAGMS
jgi:hypothetical protein